MTVQKVYINIFILYNIILKNLKDYFITKLREDKVYVSSYTITILTSIITFISYLKISFKIINTTHSKLKYVRAKHPRKSTFYDVQDIYCVKISNYHTSKAIRNAHQSYPNATHYNYIACTKYLLINITNEIKGPRP